jgi:hypothetical protein
VAIRTEEATKFDGLRTPRNNSTDNSNGDKMGTQVEVIAGTCDTDGRVFVSGGKRWVVAIVNPAEMRTQVESIVILAKPLRFVGLSCAPWLLEVLAL